MGLAEVVATLRADTSDFTAKLGAAKAEVDDLSKSGSSNFSKLATVGKAALFGIGAAAVVVGVASVDLADKYQKATNTIAANGDISVASADKIGKAFLSTAGTTIYSAQDIATAFGAVAGQVKLMNGGVLNSKAAMEVMKPAMDLAEASGENLANTTSDITNTLQAFGLKITQSPLVSNVLFNAARETGTSVDSLTNAIDKARAKMGTAAPSVQQMGGLIVDLAQHGETGRAALTALGSAFTGIISPTAAVTKAQQAMGVSFETAQGQLLPMQQIIGELAPKLAGMGNAQAAATLKSLGFGSAAEKLVGVIQAGPAAFDKATAAVARQNSAHEAAEKQAASLSHQIETLKAGLEDEGVKIGQALIPKLEDLMKIVMKVVDWFSKHKAVAEAVAIVLGGILLVAIGAYTVSMISAAAATIAATWPILAIIAVIALLAAAAYEIVEHWGAIEDFFKKVWKDVKDVFDDAIHFVEKLFFDFTPEGLIISHWRDIASFFTKVWKDAEHVFTEALSDIVGFFTGLPTRIVSALGDFLGTVFHGLLNIWDWMENNVFVPLHNWFKALPGRLYDGLSNLMSTIWADLLKIGAWFDNHVLGPAVNWFKVLPGKLYTGMGDLMSTIWADLLKVGAWFDGHVFGPLGSWFKALPSRLYNAMGNLMSTIWADLMKVGSWLDNNVWGPLGSWFKNLPGRIVTALGDVGSTLYNAGKALITGLLHGIEDAFNDVKKFVGGIAGDIASLKGPISYDSTLLVPHGNAIMAGLQQGLMQGFTSKVAPYLSGVAGSIAGGLGTNGGITPIGGTNVASGSNSGAATTVNLQINQQTFATLILPAMQSQALQAQRGQSLPVFGTTQSAV